MIGHAKVSIRSSFCTYEGTPLRVPEGSTCIHYFERYVMQSCTLPREAAAVVALAYVAFIRRTDCERPA